MATRRRPGQVLHTPPIGELVLDLATGRTGTYQGVTLGQAFIRPVGGGIEWSTAPAQLAPVPPENPDLQPVKVSNDVT